MQLKISCLSNPHDPESRLASIVFTALPPAPRAEAASPTSPLLVTHPLPHPSPASPFRPHCAHPPSPTWPRGACLCAESQLSGKRPSCDDFVRRHLPSCKQLMSFRWRKEGRQTTQPTPPVLPVEKPWCPALCVGRAGSLSFPPLEMVLAAPGRVGRHRHNRIHWAQGGHPSPGGAGALCPGHRTWGPELDRAGGWCLSPEPGP